MKCPTCSKEVEEGEVVFYVMEGTYSENCFTRKMYGKCIVVCKECIDGLEKEEL